MIVHQIKDLSNEYVTSLLIEGLLETDDPNLSPYHKDKNQNLFYKLKNGGFKNGCYFVLENNGEYIGSCGWYEYTKDIVISSRVYYKKEYRSKGYHSKYIIPLTLQQTQKYPKVWITFNKENKSLYKMFQRIETKKFSAVGFKWGEIMAKFKPIGVHHVNGVDQYVVEYDRTMI